MIFYRSKPVMSDVVFYSGGYNNGKNEFRQRVVPRILEPARNIWQRYVTFPVAFAAFGCILILRVIDFFSFTLGCRY